MAKLRNDQGSEFQIPCRCVIGRSGLAHLRIANRRISAEHCLVFWENQGWRARDLGSRNGTSINGRPLTPGQPRPLQVGDSLRLGGTEEVWALCDDEAPEPCAIIHDVELNHILGSVQSKSCPLAARMAVDVR